ncbi:methyltransferase domain-containing protein [Candidatus Dojkabacteria bacterium]|nr:methyltransferase domain-containing protein [Candidatus Dojkabacteria bacterium]
MNIIKKEYEDPDFVKHYTEENFNNPKMHDKLEEFAKLLNGNKVIDIGCGPGHDAYKFADLGFEAIGIDFSKEMIKTANSMLDDRKNPKFEVMDMLDIKTNFETNIFDGVWACASVLFIPHESVDLVLEGITSVTKDNGMIYICFKEGENLISTGLRNKYGVEREHKEYLWSEQAIKNKFKKHNFKIVKLWRNFTGKKRGQPTRWMNFYLQK